MAGIVPYFYEKSKENALSTWQGRGKVLDLAIEREQGRRGGIAILSLTASGLAALAQDRQPPKGRAARNDMRWWGAG